MERLAPSFCNRLNRSVSNRLIRLGPMLNDCTTRIEDRICSTSDDVWPSRLFAGRPMTLFAHHRKLKTRITKGMRENKTPASRGELMKLEMMACRDVRFSIRSRHVADATHGQYGRKRPDQESQLFAECCPYRRDVLRSPHADLPRSDLFEERSVLHDNGRDVGFSKLFCELMRRRDD